MSRWNDDPFSKKARKEKYLARSVYKLQEIDRREQILRGAKYVLDLGAAPGSWVQYCLQKLPKVRVIAVDIQPLEIEDPRVSLIQGSIESLDTTPLIAENRFDVVLSDVAPKTTGVSHVDVAQSLELSEKALNVATQVLKKDGIFVAKLFMGSGFEDYQQQMKRVFEKVRLIRPEGTRKQSKEIFFVGKRLKEPSRTGK